MKDENVVEKTGIFRCTCQHEYQDKRYGKKMRVHNPKKKKVGEIQKWRCTVCLTVK